MLTLLKRRIDEQRMATGMAVGVVNSDGSRIVTYGVRAANDPTPVDGDTVFEVQSLTKTFTTLLLADMVVRGEVGLDDPVERYLPANVAVPERNGRKITLRDLATHTAGLPDGFSNIRPLRDGRPGFEDYTPEDLYAYLASFQLTRDPGAAFEYSSAGMALLGHALSRKAGLEYAELVRIRILLPLGMRQSAIVPSPAMTAKSAAGHDFYLRRLEPPIRPALTYPAWALRSTARDMLAYLAAELGYRNTPLKAAMALQMSERRTVGETQMALGWGVKDVPGGIFATHAGGGRGFGAYAAFNTATRSGVIVLTNRETTTGGDIASHLLLGTPLVGFPAPRLPGPHTEVAIDPVVLAKYVGSYWIAARGQTVTLGVRDGRLVGKIAGSAELPLYPETPTELFAKGPDLLVSFRDRSGEVDGLWLQVNGEVLNATRVNASESRAGR